MPNLDDLLCNSEYPGDTYFTGQLCEDTANHSGDHYAVEEIASTHLTIHLTWTATKETRHV